MKTEFITVYKVIHNCIKGINIISSYRTVTSIWA